MQQASPLLIDKNEIAKKPIGNNYTLSSVKKASVEILIY
jgi:hypothetical protein